MKILYCLFLLILSIKSEGQVIADPATGQMDITNLLDSSLNANFLIPGDITILKVPVYNLNQLAALPLGTCKLIISLGPNLILDPSFNLATAPLSNYFLWTSAMMGGQLKITGNLIASLPADFYGNASFNLKASTLGSADIQSDFLVTNHNTATTLIDEDINNNNASLSYKITFKTVPVTFTKLLLSKTDCQVQVNFSTEKEINVKSFEIEISKDGIHYSKAGELEPKESADYHFDFQLTNDNSAPSLFVRIKSVDNDRSFKYSTTKNINGYCDKKKENLILYPNPVDHYQKEVVITKRGSLFNGQYNLAVFDISGKIIKSSLLNLLNVTQFRYNINNLSSGQYILQLITSEGEKLSNIRFNKL